MRRAPTAAGPSATEAGFSLVELMVVVTIIVIITGLAVVNYVGARENRVRAEATQSVAGLKNWEEDYFSRTGAFAFSADANDRIKFGTATTSDCKNPVVSSTFQQTTNPNATRGFKPFGCQYEYYVISDRCQADCADAGAGDACETATSPARCFCAIAIGTSKVAKNDRFCIDDLGRQYGNVTGQRGWN